jgi:urate oxidase
MAVLGANRYGKAAVRLVRVVRDTPRHELRDITVATSLEGDFTDAHVVGDQANVLPTDTQKNTVYAFAKRHGVSSPEEFALLLARHFVADIAPVRRARVRVDEHAWERAAVDGAEHDHTFVRQGGEVRTTEVIVSEDGAVSVVSGLRDLVLLKSTGSAFKDFLVDQYTTLAPTDDRIMATSLTARWTYDPLPSDYDVAYAAVRAHLLSRFGTVHSLALQQTLWEMGKAVVDDPACSVAEIELVAPNRHHLLVDLTPFGQENPGEVFVATESPYGLIEATVRRS